MELSSYIALAEAAVGIAQANLGPLVAKLSGDVAAGKAELERSASDIEEYRALSMRLREQLAYAFQCRGRESVQSHLGPDDIGEERRFTGAVSIVVRAVRLRAEA